MKVYNANGKEYKGNPVQGSYYDKTGRVRYTYKKGKLVDVATTNSFLSSISPNFAKYTSITGNKSRTTVNTGGKEYSVYSANGAYFYKSGNNYIPITDTRTINALRQNKRQTISLDRPNTSSSSNNTSTTTTTTPTYNDSGSGSGGGYVPPTYTGGASAQPDNTAIAQQNAEIEKLKNMIYELQHPKVMSAEEAAKHFGIDYNYDNILKDYNTKTNEYYNSAINEQNKLRNDYLRNNTQYADRLIQEYVDSYANAAPTAVSNAALAANALTTELNANAVNAANDYGMLQSVNALAKARDAELVTNKQLAKDYDNSLGTYLSTLTANKNTSDVKQYVDTLDSYSDMYSSARATQAALAKANSTKYAGLANAAQANAQGNATAANKYQQYWNFYNQAFGDSTLASKYMNNLMGTRFNNTRTY